MCSHQREKRLILHVGTEKTGTTSIQNLLAVNRKRLREEGFLFPQSLGPVNHTLLAAACLDDGVLDNIKAHNLAQNRCDEETFRQRLRASFEDELTSGEPWHTLIVSTELLHSRLTQPSEMECLWDFFRAFVEEINVVLFLRRQDEQALSRYSSVLRAGHSGFDDVFEDLGAHFYLRRPPERNVNDFEQYYDYRKLIERFLPVVPPENILVRSYHDYQCGDGVVKEFLNLAGLTDLPLESCDLGLNRPMSAKAQYIMGAVNKAGKPWHRNGLRNLYYKYLQGTIESENPGEPRKISREEAKRFLENFNESNEWVRSHFFTERVSLFDTDFSKYPQEVDYAPFESELRREIISYQRRALFSPLLEIKRTAIGRAFGWLKKSRNASHRFTTQAASEAQHFIRCLPRASPLPLRGSKPEFRFALARILGSDHFPRHSSNQTLTNLRFTLENEPDFPGCTKFFIVNRIFDKDTEKAIIELLNSHQVEYVQLPFEGSEYAAANWDTTPFGGDAYFSSSRFKAMKPTLRERDLCFAAAPKVRYAMNVNGARNAALEKGASLAEWVLALDGNCILTEECFRRIEKSASSYPHVPYLVLPMQRLIENEKYFSEVEPNSGKEEPQIAFHRSASERYNERLPYGFRDKAELFIRLGIRGPWQSWSRPFWHPETRQNVPERGLYKWVNATVLRLSSGMNTLDAPASGEKRYSARSNAILKSLDYLDQKYGCKNKEVEKIIFGMAQDNEENSF
ncbi:MAG: hypothetical protein P1U81_17905 [Verrucomicrobiales bacterium]|nr:hypothetical protein [Verrucomicrobiales bacterium]